jgi:hypothetical protein
MSSQERTPEDLFATLMVQVDVMRLNVQLQMQNAVLQALIRLDSAVWGRKKFSSELPF